MRSLSDRLSHAGNVYLLVRIAGRLCAFGLEHVIETMRPLPVKSLSDVPRLVSGMAIIRGVPVPVIDGALVIGARAASRPKRFVTLRVGDRVVALAVEDVVGIKGIERHRVSVLPPLLADADTAAVRAIGTLDEELMFVLEGARLIPESTWSALRAGDEQ